MATTKGITVKILGKDYQVACPPEETHHLLDAALLLDGRMKAIKESGRVIGLDRIAVITALNLAHELLAFQETTKTTQAALEQKLKDMCTKLENSMVRQVALDQN